ncbi:hypothetical protein ABPG74_021902 [Tetrahymena malaccensis]
MIKSDSTNILRSKVIDFLNSPNYQQKKSTFNINEQLTDQQKMKILKKITSESDRFQFELTYSLKNYQKATFQPPVNSQYYESVRKVEEKSKTQKEQQIEPSQLDFNSSQHSNGDYEQKANQIFLLDKFKNLNSKKNNTPHHHQSLPAIFTQSDFQIQNQANPLDKYSVSYQQNQNEQEKIEQSNSNFDAIKEEEESYSQKENSQKNQKIKMNASQKIEHNFFPLSLTKEYKNLYKQNSLKQESALNSDQNCADFTKNQKLQKSQTMFNTIKYQQIISDPLIDPFTDDIDELSALRKRSNHNILNTKISLAAPPSQTHTLIKKNNIYFFDKSNKYKKEFFVPPVKNQYLRDIQFKEIDSEQLHLNNQFYDQNQTVKVEQKEKENQDKVKKDEFSHKYYKKSSYQQQSYTLSTQTNRTLDQSSLDKFGNFTIQSALKSQKQLNKSKQSEQSVNQNSVNLSLFQNSQALNIQQDLNLLNKTQQTSIESEQLENSQVITKSQTSLNTIQNSKIIPNFLPQNPQIETRASQQINNNKLNLGDKEKQNLLINLKNTSKSKSKLLTESTDEIIDSKESITLKDLGDFQQQTSKSNKLAYDKFIFNIGEYEKNIQSLLIASLNESPQVSRKKTQLPKIKIVSKTGRNTHENPAPGYYNLLDSSSFVNKRGHTFSKAKKVSSIQLLSQYNEKHTPISNQKQQPPQEETAEQYFSKLMKEVKRQVERERRQIGQVLLRPDSIQELNSIEQSVIDRYQTELIQKMIQCKRYINSIKQNLRKDDPSFLKKF